eukprot:6231686-Prymnesium_polylepis.1
MPDLASSHRADDSTNWDAAHHSLARVGTSHFQSVSKAHRSKRQRVPRPLGTRHHSDSQRGLLHDTRTC